MSSHADQRIDPYLGTVVHVVGARQARPNLPSTGCPFCVGGLEAPDPYEVHWFPNRWPAMQGNRCEVVLYTPHHDATLPSLGVPGVRKVIDLWADRTTALGRRDDVDFVLVFENRGPQVGAAGWGTPKVSADSSARELASKSASASPAGSMPG